MCWRSTIRDPGSGKNLYWIQKLKKHRIPDPWHCSEVSFLDNCLTWKRRRRVRLHKKGSAEWRAYAGDCRPRWQLRIAAAVAGHNSRRNSPAEKTKNLTSRTYTEPSVYFYTLCGSSLCWTLQDFQVQQSTRIRVRDLLLRNGSTVMLGPETGDPAQMSAQVAGRWGLIKWKLCVRKYILHWADYSSQGRTKIYCTGMTNPTNQPWKGPPLVCTPRVPICLNFNIQKGSSLSGLYGSDCIKPIVPVILLFESIRWKIFSSKVKVSKLHTAF